MKMTSESTRLLDRLEPAGIRLGLERFRKLLEALGRPDRELNAVLVAGSNGKGSVSALLSCMTSAAGYSTGLYTSPHLEAVEERVRIDGRAISDTALASHLRVVLDASEEDTAALPTYFEALTAAALLHFAEHQVDLAILEVGLGGRLDATNVVDPVLGVITSIDYEHRAFLGDTLELIAREKAGILRPGGTVVSGVRAPEAAGAIDRRCDEVGALLWSAEQALATLDIVSRDWKRQVVELATSERRYRLEIGLLGEHQAANLAVAVSAAEALRSLGWRELSAKSVAEGARACVWPGRLEAVHLDTGMRVLLDAAHNPSGVGELRRFLEAGTEPFDLLFGVLADKDADAMLQVIAPAAGRITLTEADNPRAVPAVDLAKLVGDREVSVQSNLRTALDSALAECENTLVVCGSLALVGDVRARLRERYGVPPAAVETICRAESVPEAASQASGS